jgi:hypothetical protein
MEDFLAFRKMITPIIIQVLFWLGVVVCVVVGLVSIFAGATMPFGGGGLTVLYGLFMLIIGPILVRVYCEILILFFRMNETLTEISHNTQPGPHSQ